MHELTEFDTRAGPPVTGVVLAAGRSRRMGRPKALLVADGRTFMERTVASLREGGCAEVIVVVAAGADAESRAAADAGARVITNPQPDSPQITSIRAALDVAAGDVAAVLILPVDHPMVGAGTVAAVLEAFRETGAPIVQVRHRGELGHPVLFSRDVFDDLRRPDLPEGARSVIAAHESEAVRIPVTDRGVLADINTPEDLARHLDHGGGPGPFDRSEA